MHKKQISLICLLLVCCANVRAQQVNYEAAKKYDAPNLSKKMGTLRVIPFFLKKTNSFWFIAEQPSDSGQEADTLTADKRNSTHYIVNMKTGKRKVLFDKVAITSKLRQLTGEEVNKEQISYLPNFSDDEKTVQIKYRSQSYNYDYLKKELTERNEGQTLKNVYPKFGVSSDGKWELYSRAHNLYVAPTKNKENEQQLSKDAEPYYSFCVDEKSDYTVDRTYPSVAKWITPRYFYALRVDKRKVQTMSVINSGTMPRPRLSTYKYELPGDREVAQYELFIGDVEIGALRKVDLRRWPDQQLEVVASPDDLQELFVLRRKRTRDEMELCAVNLESGEVRSVIHEVSKPFINEDLFNVSIIKSGKEIIWWSDRSGWGQYYRYNGRGRLINGITKGYFTAGKITAIDTVKGVLYFYGYGKQAGTNPYYGFLYSVGIDGRAEKLLTPENATHQVFMSPDQNYFLDTYSRIDSPPVTLLRKKDGALVAEIFRADGSHLDAYGWKHPEPFVVKAKDGATDLYGLMWKPFDFDPKKKYPVISQVYPGPQTETVWSDFTVLDRYNNTALAQLGFVVVVVGHRGGSPIRNAEYYKFGYGNLRDNAIEDDRYALEQLADRHHYMDLKRLGIFGHSGGGMMAVAAMCTYPDFYMVGVASSGNHDNRIYNRTWGESYQGADRKIPINQDLAKNLQGHLMLVTGEIDENVNPANTYRMADALIKADKDFDLMVLPGQSHSYEGAAKSYFQKRVRAYFAKYLLGQP